VSKREKPEVWRRKREREKEAKRYHRDEEER